jgi:hypothetical protein
MLMEMSTRENGRMTRLMGLAGISILMGLSMRVIGRKTNNMEQARRLGQMVHVMKETIKMERRMVEESSCGQMGLLMMASLLIITFMEWGPTPGLINESTLASGTTTKCMAKECSHGLMAEGMKESIMTIRKVDMEYSRGLMVGCMKATGSMVNNMDLVHTIQAREK